MILPYLPWGKEEKEKYKYAKQIIFVAICMVLIRQYNSYDSCVDRRLAVYFAVTQNRVVDIDVGISLAVRP